MKKIISLILVLSIIMALAACGKTEPAVAISVGTNENNSNTDTDYGTTATSIYVESTTESVTETESTTVIESTTEASTTVEDSTKENETTIINEPTKKPQPTAGKQPSNQKPEGTTKPATKPSQKPGTTKPVTTKPTTTKPATPQVSVVTSNDIARIKSGFLKLVNEERARVGAPKLSTNAALTKAADIRSQEILNTFSHTRPNGESFETTIDVQAYPYFQIGENIQSTSHMGYNGFTKKDLFVGTDEQIVAAYTVMFQNFKNSPGHYANMTKENFIDTGISITYRIDSTTGMAIFYIVQIFGEK